MAPKQKAIFGSAFIALLIAVLTFSLVFMANASSDKWTDHADTLWYDPVYNTFKIDTSAKLAGVAKLVNDGRTADGALINGFSGKVLEVDRDLDLAAYQWVPIGTKAAPFKGTLIAKGGQTYKISGMKISGDLNYAGLVGYMDGATVGGFEFTATGSIDVVTVSNSVYNNVYGDNGVYVGSAVGKMINNSTVYNITNQLNVKVSTTITNVFAGGVVGSGEGSISNSNNYKPVTASGMDTHVGGIIGYGDDDGLKIKKVMNSGPIDASGSGKLHAGGIAGFAYGFIKMDEDATPISNSASIKVTGGSGGYAGGIVGRAGADITFSNNTTNTGAVSIDSPQASGTYAGGLAGAITAEQTQTIFSIVFTNSAAITNKGGTNVHTGGIAGFVGSTFKWDKSFTNNVSITAAGTQQLYSGGLIGKVSGDITFNSAAKNTGIISVSGRTVSQKPDEAFTGGIIGFASKRVLFESTTNRAYENSAEITVNGGTGLYTGGIVSNRAYARASGAVSNNVYSIAKITVNGQSKLYTGGFIGLVPDEGVDKIISGAEFASEIAVTGAASDPSNTISTGGIVGYYVNRSGVGSIDLTKYQGVISAVGGAETYTGGIAGYMDGGTLSQATVGNTGTTEIPFAAITAEGTIGGVAGYSKGTISGSTVKFIALTNKLNGGFTGGVAGKAQGTISNAAVGVESYSDGYSVKLESTADTVTAGGIAGHNDNALNVTGSTVTNIGLINELGRNGYTLGGVAGFLSADAIIGEPGTPIKVSKLAIDIKSANSQIGGAIGINHSPKVYVQSENLTINIAAVQAKVGGISGIQEVTKGSIPSDVSTNAAHPLKAKGITIKAQGNNARIGGLFGENLGDTPRGFAHNVSITTEGSSNQIGGIAGRNTGSITSNEARNIIIASKGISAEAGGIAGRSEAADSTVAPALIVNSSVYAEEEPLITATGANSFIGGIVGMAKSTEITNPVIRAEAPDYAMLAVKADHVIAGGIAGQIEQGKIVGDATMTNVENLMVSTSTDAPNAYVGGISGYNLKSRMERIVAANVNLIINGERAIVGGMAAYNQSTATAILVNNYIAQLNLKVNASAAASTIGGIIGVNDKQSSDPSTAPGIAVSTIQNSRYVGSIQAFSPSTVTGGMVGENRSLIANNSITDKIPVASKGNDSTLGGLVGLNTETGTLYYTYSNANLTIEGENTLAGGLVGYNKGQVITSYVDIDIASHAFGTDGNSVFLGGLIGRNSGIIEKSYSASKVTAAGAYTNVGGLVGDHVEGSITDSYAAKEVIASANGSYAGGLLGRIANGKVTTSYSAGQVTVGNGAYAGGFAGRYDNPSKELLYKNYYVKDENEQINNDLPDFAEGDHRWLLVHVRLSTILSSTLKERDIFPGLSGWDFTQAWKYGSLNADYKYPELHRSANTGGDGGSGNDVNANINWYMRDKGAINFDIKTEAELAGLAAIVNGAVTGVEKFAFEGRTVRVLNPIHIQSNQWVPIGNNEANAFLGTFEGNNYLIDGLKLLPDQSYSGLFGVIGQGAKVQHMRLEPLSVAGNQYTGVLAGLNKGTVSQIEVKLLNAGTISGNIVGGIIGKNAGALEKLSMTLDGNSRIEAVGNNAVAGGIIGDNTFALNPQVIDLKTPSGSIGSSAANATIGGIIGKQTGDFKGFRTAITAAYPISSTGANSTVGGLIGNHVSGKADDLIVTFTDGTLQALGLGSTLGGATGLSDAGNLISNVNITANQAGQHMTGNGIVGGVVGVKTGKGTNAFDMENVKTDKVVLSSLDGSTNSVIGGIAGKLSQTVVHQAVFSAFIRGKGDRVTAGGIIGYGMDSILYQVDVLSDITSVSRAGESAVGGVAGIMQSSNVDAGLDFGKLIPFYRGIYDAVVHSKAMEVKGADNGPDLYVGGVVGKNMAASIYNSRSTSDLAVNGAKIAAVGGVAGYSDGIIVSSSASSNINADTSTIYDVGGVVGWTAGGAIHYSNMNAPGGQKITVGSAITKPGVMPATRVGGFAGNGDNTNITHSYANIPVIVVCTNQENTIYAGGFAGLLGDLSSGSGLIQQVYAKGIVDVKGITGSYAGGFAGSIDHYSISDAYATGSITNTGFDTSSGGFAGAVERRGIVKNAYAIQDKVATIGINHATRSYGGGFVGYNDGTLDGVFAKVAELSMSVSGANAYKGSLVGYNFRDGKIVQSSYVGALNAVGYNLGSTPGVVQADSTNSYAFGNWNFETDPSFLTGKEITEVVIKNPKQLTSIIRLYNDTGLDYFRLFNRTATEKPVMNKFSLGADIDLSGSSWTPFASFRGEFDGKGKKVTGLKLLAVGSDLNGFVSENYGNITNLVFEDADIVAGSKTGGAAGVNHIGASLSDIVIRGKVKGNDYVGGAVGDNKGTVVNVTVEVSSVEGANYVGGVSGVNSGSIAGAVVKGDIAGTGNYAGGITGSNEGQVSKATSRGTVRALTPGLTLAVGGIAGENKGSGTITEVFSYSDVKGNNSVGGAIGDNKGTISNATVEVSGVEGADYVGGAIGDNKGTISNVTVEVSSVKGATYVGGVSGANSGSIAGAVVKGDIAGTGNYAGGITGSNEGQVSKATSRGTVRALTPGLTIAVGGIAGENKGSGTITEVFSYSDVKGNNSVGGAIGDNKGTISNVTVEVSGVEGASYVGGLTGVNSGSITEAAIKGAITGSGSYVGGIAGSNEGQVSKATSRGTVRALTPGLTIAVGGIAGENKGSGTITEVFSYSDIKGNDSVGGAIGDNKGTISNVTVEVSGVEGASYVGGLTGVNSGSITEAAIKGAITGSGSYVGGIAGSNEGQVSKAYSRGIVRATAPGLTLVIGGIAGENKASGTISQVFSYSDIEAASSYSMAGGIAGLNEGAIGNSYSSGRVKAEGTEQSKAGGIAGYAAGGVINFSLNYGEVIAGVDGKILTAKAYFGGIAGQKEDAAVVSHTAFNKQMLKSNSAYYMASGTRVTGDNKEAAGMLASELTGTLPASFDSSLWKAEQGFYPQLSAFSGTVGSKLSAAAVVLSKTDLINLIRTGFDLTKDASVVWSANPNEALISNEAGTVRGSLKTVGSAVLTVSSNGESRTITVNAPSLKYSVAATKPKFSSGDFNFTDQVTVTLSTDEPGGKIYYTLDGSVPDAYSTLYTGPIVLRSTTNLKAITVIDDKENSELLTGIWVKRESSGGGGGGGGFVTPAAPQPAVTAQVGQTTVKGNSDSSTSSTVAMNSKLKLTAPEGQIIYYTTDGSTPTTSSTQYIGEIIITGNMTIKLITDKDDRVITMNYQAENAKYDLKSDAGQIKFISGYEDGQFKPDAAMSRYDLIHVLAPLLNMEEVSVQNRFKDVKSGIEELVAFFTSAGIVDGYPDGTFGGEKGLSRAEFVVLMSRVIKLDITSNGETSLSDVRGHWSEKYVNAFTKAGYVQGFPDGTFEPDSQISRAQAIVVINRITGAQKQTLPSKFSDLTPDHWAFDEIMPVVK